ncbi:unnamed protein product [Cylindrotheca closterium]|uniref:Leucine-rich repeat-containing N-terminal plant-type domain-containing protein n=1 Tax=Cylindrotheca closterium TaxID=2856 RepID=A0AAD2FGJ9_9STRA|nr:unnamed protein product [Cylindrotheca closterium]CAJ1960736.1 unnamed protein product [Cylindrotheca closterium]
MSPKKSDAEIKEEQRKVAEDEDVAPGAFHSVTNSNENNMEKDGDEDDQRSEQRRQIVSQYVLNGSDDQDRSSFFVEGSQTECSSAMDDSQIKSEAKRQGPLTRNSNNSGVTAVRGKSNTKVTGPTVLATRQSINVTEDDDDTTAVPPGVPLRRSPFTYRENNNNNDPTTTVTNNPPRQEEETKAPESQDGSELAAELVDERKDQERLKQTLENVLQTQNAVQVVDVEAEDRLKRQRQRRNFCLYAFLGSAVLAGVVAAVVVTSSRNQQQTAAPTILPSMSPTMAPTTRESAVVEAVVSEFGDLPEDEDAPQHAAIQWLTDMDTTIEFPLDSEESEHIFLERYAAAVFGYSTQYSSWFNNDNWLDPNVSVCDWFGLTCNDDERIAVLDLAVQNLDGHIPSEIGYLDNLDFVFLFRNKLRGTIPPEVGKLGDVDFMYLNENLLTGQIPDELSGLLDADELFLFGNQLNGTIPAAFGGLVDLVNLYMHDNRLSGEIPSSLSQLKRLQRLYLQDNNIQGQIPSELGGIISLQRIQLHNNRLTGQVPSELGGFLGLSVLTLQDNNLTGEMPEDICALRDAPIDDLEVLEADCATNDTGVGMNCTCCSFCW